MSQMNLDDDSPLTSVEAVAASIAGVKGFDPIGLCRNVRVLHCTPTQKSSSVQENGYLLSEESTVEGSHAQEDAQGSKRFARLRACERCQRMKVRCEINDNSQRCKRCDQANRDCVPTESRPKRRRTDRRVTELEQKVASLTASLVAHGHSDGITTEAPIAQMAEGGADQPITQQGTDDSVSAFPGINKPPSQRRQETTFRDEIGAWIGIPGSAASFDAIKRQILDAATAYQIFNRYHLQMSQYFPFVVFSYTTKPEHIRRTKPILFHAILAVAAAPLRPDLRPLLIDEITQIMADRVMYRGEKSVELIQALLVLVVHYQRPRQSKELNFLQIVHSAAIMALDLGLGKRSTRKGTDGMAPESTMNEAEVRRVWLGCYYLCANVSMALRNPMLIRWSSYIEECLEFFAASSAILPSDAWLCHLVRNQHIAEDVAILFSMDDPASIVSLSDPKIKFLLRSFEQRLENWKSQAAKLDVPQAIIQHVHATTNLYIHEIAVHLNHNVDDFRPHHKVSQDPDNDILPADPIDAANITSFTTCIESICETFDAFLTMDLSAIRNLPILFFVRSVYAGVVLLKSYGIVHVEGSTLGAIFAPELRTEYYLNAMVDHLAKAAGDAEQQPVAWAFRLDFVKLRAWHEKRRYKLMNKAGPRHTLQHQGTASNVDNSNTSLPFGHWSTGIYTSNRSHVTTQPGCINVERSLSHQDGSDTLLPNPDQFDLSNFDFTFDELNAMDSLMENAGWTSFLL